MHGSQQVGEALEHKDLRRNRRRHSTNILLCDVEGFVNAAFAVKRKTVTLFPFLQCGTSEHNKHAILCDDALIIHEMLNIHRRT